MGTKDPGPGLKKVRPWWCFCLQF